MCGSKPFLDPWPSSFLPWKHLNYRTFLVSLVWSFLMTLTENNLSWNVLLNHIWSTWSVMDVKKLVTRKWIVLKQSLKKWLLLLTKLDNRVVVSWLLTKWKETMNGSWTLVHITSLHIVSGSQIELITPEPLQIGDGWTLCDSKRKYWSGCLWWTQLVSYYTSWCSTCSYFTISMGQVVKRGYDVKTNIDGTQFFKDDQCCLVG